MTKEQAIMQTVLMMEQQIALQEHKLEKTKKYVSDLKNSIGDNIIHNTITMLATLDYTEYGAKWASTLEMETKAIAFLTEYMSRK